MRKMKTWKMRTHTVGTGSWLENGGNMENETLTL